MWTLLLFFVLIGLLTPSPSIASWNDGFHEHLATYLRPGEPHIQDGQMLLNMLYMHNQVQVFCQRPTPLTWWNVFQSNRLRLQIAAGGDYSQYKGATIREIFQAHRLLNECYEGKPLGSSAAEQRIIPMTAHEHVCYGIYTNEPFVLTLEEISCDLERMAQFTFALVLWLSCPHLADSLLGFYCSAATVGAHLAGVAVVGITLVSSNSERSLELRTLKENFKEVLQERPTVMTLSLVFGAWLLQSACQRFYYLWRRSLLRRLHHRFLRITSYWLILSASDDRTFGWICISLLIPWPELWWLMRWLRIKYASYQQVLKDFQETSHQVSRMLQPRISSRFSDGGIDLGIATSDNDYILFPRNDSSNRSNMNFYQEERERRYEESGDSTVSNFLNRPSTWNCLNRRLQLTPNQTEVIRTRSSGSQEPYSSPKVSVTTLYKNLSFSNSERSLRDQ
ncbi:uncharacterized protein [Drosophila takahashii]|uniref:uncharacterized protein n=1 Tax=Drosophila takahashii TaxID=29030 RepID=UPI001CF86E0B|nr:uncharacterized protein LOC108067898 [Drosophila takahashii]